MRAWTSLTARGRVYGGVDGSPGRSDSGLFAFYAVNFCAVNIVCFGVNSLKVVNILEM